MELYHMQEGIFVQKKKKKADKKIVCYFFHLARMSYERFLLAPSGSAARFLSGLL